MTQEEKQLLLKDLCARLPYGVKVKKVKNNFDINYFNHNVSEIKLLIEECDIKPYLRPMSSMTKEERNEVKKHMQREQIANVVAFYHATEKTYDWYNAHHFDYRGLIEKGLAIEVTEENNPYIGVVWHSYC